MRKGEACEWCDREPVWRAPAHLDRPSGPSRGARRGHRHRSSLSSGMPASPVSAETLSQRIASARARQNSLNRDIARQNRLLDALEKDADVARGAIAATDRILDGINADQQRAARGDQRRAQGAGQGPGSPRDAAGAAAPVGRDAGPAGARDPAGCRASSRPVARRSTSGSPTRIGPPTPASWSRCSPPTRSRTCSRMPRPTRLWRAGLADGRRRSQQEQAALDSLRAVTSATKYRKDQLRRAAHGRGRRHQGPAGQAQRRDGQYQQAREEVQGHPRSARRARARRIASNKRQAQAYIRRQAAARRKLNSHIAGLVRRPSGAPTSTAVAARAARPATAASCGRRPAPSPRSTAAPGFRLEPPRGGCAHFHSGIDIANGSGTPIRAAGDGVVAFVGWNQYDGSDPAFIVMIAHARRHQHVLLAPPAAATSCAPGQRVRKGQLIGYMGSTGNATGPASPLGGHARLYAAQPARLDLIAAIAGPAPRPARVRHGVRSGREAGPRARPRRR